MAKFDVKKYWWVVVIVVAALGMAVKLIVDQWLPAYQTFGDIIPLVLIGAVFCWAYAINRELNWWSIIPGLGIFSLLAAGLSDFIVGSSPKNDWVNVLVFGAGAVIIGVVLKRADAKSVLIVVAMFIFLVGILMAPFAPVIKGALIAVDILACGFFAWRLRKTPVKINP